VFGKRVRWWSCAHANDDPVASATANIPQTAKNTTTIRRMAIPP
jgi:hypothetical protein